MRRAGLGRHRWALTLLSAGLVLHARVALGAPPESADAPDPSSSDPFGLSEIYDETPETETESETEPESEPNLQPVPESQPVPDLDPEGPELGDAATQPGTQYVPLHRVLQPRSGKKMMIAGGVVYGLGFLGQIGGLRIIHRTCANTPAESVQDGDFLSALSCGAGFAGGGLLLFFSAIPEFVGAPWLIAGATFNGRKRAFDDHFFGGASMREGRRMKAYIWSGAGLITLGALSWFISPGIAANSCKANPRLTCSVDATTWGFNLGLGAMTAGGALLGHGLAYRRGFREYRTHTPVSVVPNFGRGHGGLSLRGRF